MDRAGVKAWRAACRITGGLKRQATCVGRVILHFAVGGDFGEVVPKPVRPHAMLRQQQQCRQQYAEQGQKEALHDAESIGQPADPDNPRAVRARCAAVAQKVQTTAPSFAVLSRTGLIRSSRLMPSHITIGLATSTDE